MDSRNEYGFGPSDFVDDVSYRDGSSSFGWNMFLFAVAVAMIAVNWGFLRPASRQLQEMRAQIRTLETNIELLTQQHSAAGRTTNLLALLTEQGQRSEQAAASLTQIRKLHDQLVRENSRLRDASRLVDQLAALRQQVTRQSELIEDTRLALQETNDIQQKLLLMGTSNADAELALNRLSQTQQRMSQTDGIVAESERLLNDVDSLHRHLLSTATMHEEAQVVADQMVEISETLVAESEETVEAQLTLDDLVNLREDISAQTADVALSRQTVNDMARLQRDVLSQTETIADAIVTLEQTADLAAQFREASDSFVEVRKWLTEVILMEPTLQRAMHTLEPITALGNLRRVSWDEMRQAAQVVRDIREAEMARSRKAESSAEVASAAEFEDSH